MPCGDQPGICEARKCPELPISIGTRVGKPPSGESVTSPPESDDWKRMASPLGDQAGAPETTDSTESSWSMVRTSASWAWSGARSAAKVAAATRVARSGEAVARRRVAAGFR